MTSHAILRCRHCRVRYSYQTSGYGCGDSQNSDIYCPECQINVLAALERILQKVEKTWVTITDQTQVAAVCASLAVEEAKPAANDSDSLNRWPKMRRIFPELIKLDPTGRMAIARTTTKEHVLNGATYHIEEWSDGSGTRVSVMVERDLKTGNTRPWRE